jgi:hypothetical protein
MSSVVTLGELRVGESFTLVQNQSTCLPCLCRRRVDGVELCDEMMATSGCTCQLKAHTHLMMDRLVVVHSFHDAMQRIEEE